MFVKVVSKTADSKEIVDYFMNKYSHSTDEADKIDMFRFIQYIERQIVLFDAVEDAAFPIVNNMEAEDHCRISKKSRCKRKERRID
jgi:phosphoenolpyruvate carboxylase